MTAAGPSDDEARDGYTQSIDLTLPPLSTLVFKWISAHAHMTGGVVHKTA